MYLMIFCTHPDRNRLTASGVGGAVTNFVSNEDTPIEFGDDGKNLRPGVLLVALTTRKVAQQSAGTIGQQRWHDGCHGMLSGMTPLGAF